MRGLTVLLGALALGCGDRPALGPGEMATSNQTRFNLTVEEFASIPDNFTVDRIVTRFGTPARSTGGASPTLEYVLGDGSTAAVFTDGKRVVEIRQKRAGAADVVLKKDDGTRTPSKKKK